MTTTRENAAPERTSSRWLGRLITAVTAGLFAATPLSIPRNTAWPELFDAPLMPWLLGTIVSVSVVCAFWITFGNGRFLARLALVVLFWGLALLTCFGVHLAYNLRAWNIDDIATFTLNEFFALGYGSALCVSAALVATLIRRYWSGWHLAGRKAPPQPKQTRMLVLIVLFVTLAAPFGLLATPVRVNPYVYTTASSLALLVILGSVGAIMVGPLIWRLIGAPQTPQAKWSARLAGGVILAACIYFWLRMWRGNVTDLIVMVGCAVLPTAAAFWWLGRRGLELRQYDFRQMITARRSPSAAPAKHPLDD
ncbi:MAG: hypothetical protein AAGF97_15855 [Planctomycetota bacterium]